NRFSGISLAPSSVLEPNRTGLDQRANNLSSSQDNGSDDAYNGELPAELSGCQPLLSLLPFEVFTPLLLPALVILPALLLLPLQQTPLFQNLSVLLWTAPLYPRSKRVAISVPTYNRKNVFHRIVGSLVLNRDRHSETTGNRVGDHFPILDGRVPGFAVDCAGLN